MSRVVIATALVGLAACGGPRERTPVVAEIVPTPTSGVGASPVALEDPEPKLPTIGDRRVGDVVIEEPLPSKLAREDLAPLYETSYYADAQPLEGFALRRPPMFVAVAGGPFHPFGMATPGEPIPESMPAEAAERARRGELTVSMIVITDPALVTAEGMGVGKTFADVQRAYPELDAYTFPGLWEEPSCIARPTPTSTIHFFFDGCQLARDGEPFGPDHEVLRVVVIDTAD